MQPSLTAWYVARTKPKHEHIAAANLRKQLGLEVFSPRLRLEKLTKRGLVSVTESLFPCYIFVHCSVGDQMNQIQHTSGVSHLVHFGGVMPKVANDVIAELREWFESEEIMVVDSNLAIGDEVTLAVGAFSGMSASVLKCLPAKKRVQILLEVLGQPTMVEVEREAVVLKKSSLADMAPFLAASIRQERVSA